MHLFKVDCPIFFTMKCFGTKATFESSTSVQITVVTPVTFPVSRISTEFTFVLFRWEGRVDEGLEEDVTVEDGLFVWLKELVWMDSLGLGCWDLIGCRIR